MKGQNKNSRKKPTDVEKVLLATAVLSLIKTTIELIKLLLE